MMVVGVNGAGKTTTIGKIAHQYSSQKRKVLIGAADTFRAAAVEQLEVWAQRAGADLIKQSKGTDPSAVAFDSIQAAKSRNTDLVFVDTAGRLHTKVNLMEELKKLRRIISRECPGAPHEVLLVLDATNGQNAISQAKLFHEAIGVTGIALTKLDGTAKGGIIVGITRELNIPLRYIGVGKASMICGNSTPQSLSRPCLNNLCFLRSSLSACPNPHRLAEAGLGKIFMDSKSFQEMLR